MTESVDKIGVYVPLTTEETAFAAAVVVERVKFINELAAAVDRKFNPWAYPDRNPFPAVSIWPEWWRRVLERLRRRCPQPV